MMKSKNKKLLRSFWSASWGSLCLKRFAEMLQALYSHQLYFGKDGIAQSNCPSTLQVCWILSIESHSNWNFVLNQQTPNLARYLNFRQWIHWISHNSFLPYCMQEIQFTGGVHHLRSLCPSLLLWMGPLREHSLPGSGLWFRSWFILQTSQRLLHSLCFCKVQSYCW